MKQGAFCKRFSTAFQLLRNAYLVDWPKCLFRYKSTCCLVIFCCWVVTCWLPFSEFCGICTNSSSRSIGCLVLGSLHKWKIRIIREYIKFRRINDHKMSIYSQIKIDVWMNLKYIGAACVKQRFDNLILGYTSSGYLNLI